MIFSEWIYYFKAEISEKVVGCGFRPNILRKSELIGMNQSRVAGKEQASSINKTSIGNLPSYYKASTFIIFFFPQPSIFFHLTTWMDILTEKGPPYICYCHFYHQTFNALAILHMLFSRDPSTS